MKLSVRNLDKSFGTLGGLKKLNFDIPSFQTLTLIGPSGGGKSTLLKLIAGLVYPDQGTIALDGKEILFDETSLREHRLQLGVVFQSWNLFPHLTALENITLPLYRVHGYSKENANDSGMDLLKRFELGEHADKKPYELSGGQCQRVAIIRAIATKPKLLLLDEPTSALDPLMTSEVLDLVLEQKRAGTNLILVTHHLSFARKIADWVLFIAEGNVIANGAIQEVFDHPSSPFISHYLDKVLNY
jgi:polar amino acid transport system ATP-binding protein